MGDGGGGTLDTAARPERLTQGRSDGIVLPARRLPGCLQALVAATPGVLVKTVLDTLGLAFPFLEIVVPAMRFGYLCYGLNASGKPAEDMAGGWMIPSSPA
jgi:hypothetical protein